MKVKRFYIETWGCQMNHHDSEGIGGILEREGFAPTESPAKADIIIFNTCAVRQKAEEKVYGRMGLIKELKEEKDLLFGLIGCIPQVYGEKLRERFPVIDFLLGPAELNTLPRYLCPAKAGENDVEAFPGYSLEKEIPYLRRSPVQGMITITEGCSNFCSYCIVPYARGPLRSRPPEAILAEVDTLIQAGYKEVLLLGQNVDSYGRDNSQYGDFPALLKKVAQTGIPRIRFTTSHPRDMTLKVLETMAQYENVCPHLHLACQSGSDQILKTMNRGYTRQMFLDIVQAARTTVDGINITTDLIVGHPGETDADFRATMDLVEEARFGSIFAAKYSPRPGTRSATFLDDVPEEIKDVRLQKILKRAREIAIEENEAYIGSTVEVLVEGKTRLGMSYGRTTDHRTVVVRGSARLGTFVPVRIETASAAALNGEVLIPAATEGVQ